MAKYVLICAINWLLLRTVHAAETPSNVIIPECLEISTFTEGSNNITSPNYPQPYPTGCTWEWTVDATGKSELHVTFQSFDINNETNDQLSIQIFEGEKEIGSKVTVEEGKEIKLDWEDNGGHRMIEFLFKVANRNESNVHTGFSLHYELFSNISVTNQPEAVKELAQNGSDGANNVKVIQVAKETTEQKYGFIVVNLLGKSKDEFTDLIQDKFRDYMAGLATPFCKERNITSDDVKSTAVKLNSVVSCPSDWPDSNICITVNFSIPINGTEDELTVGHLHEIWNTHADVKLMNAVGVEEFDLRGNNFVLIIWLATTGTLFLLFLAILAIVLRTRVVENYIKRTRREHMSGYGVYERSRFAQQPNQQQLVPPFFYPDERIVIDQKNFNSYGVEPLHKNITIGQENPAFVADSGEKRVTNQISQEAIDDFDSDDDTLYPPSPLARQTSNRKQMTIPVNKSPHELETAF